MARATENQPAMIRLNVGMDQSQGSRGATPGTLDLVKNCRIRSGGLQKRCGSAAIAGTTETNSAGYSLADTASVSRPTEKAAFVGKLGNQKLAGTSAGHVFAYGGTKWDFRAAVSAAQPVRSRLGLAASLVTKPVGPYMPAVGATSDGYICTAAGFGDQLKVTVESPNGDLLLDSSETVGAASVIVRVAVVGAKFIVCYQGSASTVVNYWIISVVNGAISSDFGSSLVTLANASSTWDVSNYDGTNWWLVYQSGATTVTLAKMNTTPAVASSVTFSSTDNRTYLSVWGDATNARIFVGVVDDPTGASTGQFRIYTATPTLSVGPTSLSNTPTGVPLFGPLYERTQAAGDAFGVFWTVVNSQAVLCTLVIQAGAKTGERSIAVGAVPISKPDTQCRVWCMTHAPGTNFKFTKVALLRLSGKDFVGVTSNDAYPIVELASPDFETPGATYHPYAQPGRAFQSVAVTSESAGGASFFALPFVLTSRTNASGGTEPTTRVNVYEYTRYNQAPHQPMVPVGRAAYVAGQPTELYGEPYRAQFTSTLRPIGGVELGYVHGPSVVDSLISASGSGLPVGTYVYQAVYQWVDDEGSRQLSQPSEPFTVTLTVPSSVRLDFNKCYLGQRTSVDRPLAEATPTILLYRTANGATEPDMVPIEADASSNFFRFTDTVADGIIDDNEFIYTAGGVLPNVLAPSCRYIAISEERMWCGGLWDTNIIECSKVRVPGEPYNFTGDASHQVVIPGEVSGLAYMDGQVCVFTEDAIYIVSGDGPNDQGAGGFAPPRALVRGIGCPREQSASILETEAGLLFRSKMGFYLIPRGYGTPLYIGEKVNEEDSVVLSAATTTTEEFRLARFLVCAPGETKSDTVLTLDLTTMQWIRDEYTVNGSTTGQGFSEIGEWPDGLALMSYGLDRTDNAYVVWAEDEDLTGDAGAAGAGATTYISQYARTAWIQGQGPLGLQRCAEVVLSCEPRGSSSLVTMTVETDANADDPASWTITTSEEVAYRSIPVKEPVCTEFRVTLQDAAGAANSAGVRFLALGFQTQPIPGLRRVTDSQGN